MSGTEETMSENDTKARFNAKTLIFVLIFAILSFVYFMVSTIKWGKFGFMTIIPYVICMLLWLIPLILSIVKGGKKSKIPGYIIVLSIIFFIMDLFVVFMGEQVSKFIAKNNFVEDLNIIDTVRVDIEKVVADYDSGIITDGNESYNELCNGVCISDWNEPYDDLQSALIDEFMQSNLFTSYADFQALPNTFSLSSSKSEVYVKVTGQDVYVELLEPQKITKKITYNDGRISSPAN